MDKDRLIESAKSGVVEFNGNVPVNGNCTNEMNFEPMFVHFADKDGIHACKKGDEDYLESIAPFPFDAISDEDYKKLSADIKTITMVDEAYLAFVDVPDEKGRYWRYYLEKHTPDGIHGNDLVAKRYARKKDAENAARWLCNNIRPNWSNGLDFQSKGKRCGVVFRQFTERREETILTNMKGK